jgi:hypothetical protein
VAAATAALLLVLMSKNRAIHACERSDLRSAAAHRHQGTRISRLMTQNIVNQKRFTKSTKRKHPCPEPNENQNSKAGFRCTISPYIHHLIPI